MDRRPRLPRSHRRHPRRAAAGARRSRADGGRCRGLAHRTHLERLDQPEDVRRRWLRTCLRLADEASEHRCPRGTTTEGRPPLDRRLPGRHRGASARPGLDRRARPARGASGGARRGARATWRWRWTSPSCSIPSASCSRSAIPSTENSLDPSCYDLLASEARLASLFAIAKGDVPTGTGSGSAERRRPSARASALISWSGSMFEYLMPPLVMREPAGSLLAQTNRLVVARQQAYARSLGIPWGVSESAFNARDLELTYQYSNFGVPGLGLKRGLADNVVIAPYATGLAAMIDPQGASATSRAWRWARAAATASTRRWTSTRRGAPRAKPSPSCAASWPITRA
jgi:hypothetical protein